MSIFNFIKSRISIVDVVNEYTTLKKAGAYLKSRCPFHHEKTASFSVSPHKEIYYCFGCHVGGDVISFISKVENCSQLEAAQFLAGRYNLEVPADLFRDVQHDKKKQYYDICKAFALWAHGELLKHPAVMKYLQERHINRPLINYFTVGFLPDGFSAIKHCVGQLNKENILVDDLINAHIVMRGKSVLYSPFEGRIIFPIKDQVGRFCGFGGRIYKAHDQRPKYYNSRENDFFIKRNILFGLDLAKKKITDADSVFLVEGYTDCIAMIKHGYGNTVATLGTACTLNHLKTLSRYANYVYILYDNDKAGHDAVLRLTHLCWQVNMELKVVQLPAGDDPASFLASGSSLDDRIAHAEDIFTFFVNSLGANFSVQPLAHKMDRIQTLLEIIRNISDQLKQDLLLQLASRTFDIPFESLRRHMEKIPVLNGVPSEVNETSPTSAADEPSLLEKYLFCAIINHIDQIPIESLSWIIDVMASPLKEILKHMLGKRGKESFDFSEIFDTLNSDDKQYVSKILLEYDEPNNHTHYNQLVVQFQKQQWKKIVRTITTELEQAQRSGDIQAVQKILHDYAVLKKKIFLPITHKTTKDE